jgi:predicted XRE-type DNA-binding protein
MNTMSKERTGVEPGSGNVYADLGFGDAAEMLVKAQLAHQIAAAIKRRRLTQQDASEIIGIPQPKLSALLRGQFRGISQAKMIGCLNRLGHDVDIVVRKRGRRALGQTQVVLP